MPDKKKKVLIIDDEKNLVALVALHIRMAGHDPIYALDGEQGLLSAEEKKPDVIILDLMLPEIDGLEVCRRIRANPNIKDIPIIMLTAQVGIESRLKGFEMGADDYVMKPFSPKELVARVNRILARAAHVL
ncbi:MAG TPA: response regulator [Candidatus Omnitrophota bacterium]|nr:response regulator [Candidatus Omnitrophota bacterium]